MSSRFSVAYLFFWFYIVQSLSLVLKGRAPFGEVQIHIALISRVVLPILSILLIPQYFQGLQKGVPFADTRCSECADTCVF